MRHKDSYIHDKNNEIHGTSLRKLSMIIFLNDNLEQGEQGGMLRLYPKGNSVEDVVDITTTSVGVFVRVKWKGYVEHSWEPEWELVGNEVREGSAQKVHAAFKERILEPDWTPPPKGGDGPRVPRRERCR